MRTYQLLEGTAWCCCLFTLTQITIVSSATLSTSASPSVSTENATSTTLSSTVELTNSTNTTSSTQKATTAAITTTQSVSTTTTAADAADSTTKTTAKSPSLTTLSAPVTTLSPASVTVTSATTASSASTVAPSIGQNCTGKTDSWCNQTISGAVECSGSGQCQCQQGHFAPDNSTCMPVNDLKPTEFIISNIMTTSFMVSWSHKVSVIDLELDYNVTARLVDNSISVPLVTCNNGSQDRLYSCTGLLPGYMYEVTITVMYNNELSVNDSKQESTIPSIPGRLDLTLSNLTYPDVTLIWKDSQGRVDSYHVRVFQNESRTVESEVFNETSIDNMVHVTKLKPVTDYYITIIANSHGKPSGIRTDTFLTLYDAPDPVTNVSVVALNATSVKVSWVTSNENPDIMFKYEVTTNNMVDNSPSNQSCLVQERNVSECIVSGLEEYWVYSFNVDVLALNRSSSQTVSENVTTAEGVPGKISKAGVSFFNAEPTCDATKVKVNWEEPHLYDRNSKITKYVLQVLGEIIQLVDNPDPYRAENRKFEEEISNLKPSTKYVLNIHAVSSSENSGPISSIKFETDVCAPPDWSNAEVQIITERQSTPSSVTIYIPNTFFTKTQQGSFAEKGFVVLPQGSQYFDGSKNIKLDDIIFNWQNSKDNLFVEEYKIIVTGEVPSESFEIGEDQCTTSYCNGPLPEKFTFKVAAYACTRKKGDRSLLCTVTSPTRLFATKAKPVPRDDSPSAMVIVLAILMVVLAAIAAFTFLWYKEYINPASWFSKKDDDGDDDGPFTPLDKYVKSRPIKISEYVQELDEMHKDTHLVLSDQYDDITKFGQMIADISTTNAARHEDNTPKNRWVNILPFDHSRVKLQQIDEDEQTTDYINANFMPGFNNKREYIATQGPLPGTIDDFWRMVWEHGVMVIVMLTQCKEGNRIKCEKYWPDELREPKQYGDVVVNPISISQLDKYNISIFEVSVNDETRQVIHFHYLDFPDFSANVEFDHFINFVRTVRSHVPHDMKGPMVIHCSAGVGRTGTFIATDRLHLYLSSDKFSEDDTVDIYGIVVGLRENRVFMVQTESQYIMIHDCFEKMLEEKRAALKVTDSDDNLYENQGFDPYPDTLYENISAQEQTEL